ncbi:MAG: FAD binding domain-containing protein [Anaerolineae bacterium]|nr:FAD binding domain-containing protein [Anaerolineae bacterium]
MPLWHHYHIPTTVEEALAHLARYDGKARIIAGGTDLLIDLQHTEKGAHTLDALVDVTRIQAMTEISASEGWIYVGAAVTHTAVVDSALIELQATCLVESCGVVGGPQVRNVGTLGGNVAHALPAGDGTTSLIALDAEAHVAWADGRREWLPIGCLFKGPGESAIDSTRDVLVGFRFRPCAQREATAFKRIMRPQGVALPILGCAVWLKLDDRSDHCADVRICIGPVGSIPARASEAENALRGQVMDDETIQAVADIACQTLHPRTSKYRATADYRVYMIETLLKQALPLAARRAQTGIAQAEGVGLG